MRNNSKIIKDTLTSIREQALEDAARTVKSIRRQKECEPDNEMVSNALRNSEETMFFLAVNHGGDDERRCIEILSEHGLTDIG